MFEKGNKLWQLADHYKVGRPPLFVSPFDLWESVKEYFQFIDENPILKTDFKGKDAEMVTYDLQRPYTWQGLYVFLGVKDLEHYKTKDEFSEIIAHIGNIIYSNKYDGAAVGIFNPSIIQRDLGLQDNIKNEIKGELISPILKVRMVDDDD